MIDVADLLWLLLIAWAVGCAWGYYGGRQDGYRRGALDALQRLRDAAHG